MTGRLAPVSNVNILVKLIISLAIYKLYLEVEVLGLDIRNLTIREDRIFRLFFFIVNIIINVIIYIYWTDASLNDWKLLRMSNQ